MVFTRWHRWMRVLFLFSFVLLSLFPSPCFVFLYYNFTIFNACFKRVFGIFELLPWVDCEQFGDVFLFVVDFNLFRKCVYLTFVCLEESNNKNEQCFFFLFISEVVSNSIKWWLIFMLVFICLMLVVFSLFIHFRDRCFSFESSLKYKHPCVFR